MREALRCASAARCGFDHPPRQGSGGTNIGTGGPRDPPYTLLSRLRRTPTRSNDMDRTTIRVLGGATSVCFPCEPLESAKFDEARQRRQRRYRLFITGPSKNQRF